MIDKATFKKIEKAPAVDEGIEGSVVVVAVVVVDDAVVVEVTDSQIQTKQYCTLSFNVLLKNTRKWLKNRILAI